MNKLNVKTYVSKLKNNRTSEIMRNLTKRFSEIGMRLPNYIKTGEYTENQLTNLINNYNKNINVFHKLNNKLDKSISEYNNKMDKIEKDLNLNQEEKAFFRGEDIFTSANRSFYKQGLTTKRINLENMNDLSLSQKRDFIKTVNSMKKNLSVEAFNQELDRDRNRQRFIDFLNEPYNEGISDRDKQILLNNFENLSTISQLLFLDSYIQNLVEKYEFLDGDEIDLTSFGVNIFNNLNVAMMNLEKR